MLKLAWLLPFFPLAAFVATVILTALGKASTTSRNRASRLAVGAMSGAWLLAWGVVGQAVATPGFTAYAVSTPWLPTGGPVLAMGVSVDPLTVVMLFMVPFVSLMIFIYAQAYMAHDPRYARFFAYLSLFAAGMLALVLADNLLLLFVAWEIMGLCSYLLIGFWFERPAARLAAVKAFLTTRVGDVLLFAGIALLFAQTGSLSFTQVLSAETLQALATTPWSLGPFGTVSAATVIAVLIFGGAVGKSAQFPLHVWLPDAMEGPTPVSALIHAATMVAAGVYLVARTLPLFAAVPDSPALQVVAAIGAITAFFAATAGVAQSDMKRMMAYSTISQLGYMMMALGLGGLAAGMFHLITHAFFKALLFLSAGSINHSTETNDMTALGGLRHRMPLTFAAFVIGALALAGVAPLSGFWSKDEILGEAFAGLRAGLPLGLWAWLAGTAAAFFTALYVGRTIALIFYGRPRSAHAARAHESPPAMTAPLLTLGAFTAVLGLASLPPGRGWLQGFLAGVHTPSGLQHEAVPFSALVAAVSSVVALVGLAGGWGLYRNYADGAPDPLAARLGRLYRLAENGYYVDSFYRLVIVRFVKWLSGVLFRVDARWLIDPLVNAAGRLANRAAETGAAFDARVVDGAVNGLAEALLRAGRAVRRLQTGRVQDYLLWASSALLLLLLLYLVR
jgi:NADH-quinone oxidoreductase subunit L